MWHMNTPNIINYLCQSLELRYDHFYQILTAIVTYYLIWLINPFCLLTLLSSHIHRFIDLFFSLSTSASTITINPCHLSLTHLSPLLSLHLLADCPSMGVTKRLFPYPSFFHHPQSQWKSSYFDVTTTSTIVVSHDWWIAVFGSKLRLQICCCIDYSTLPLDKILQRN